MFSFTCQTVGCKRADCSKLDVQNHEVDWSGLINTDNCMPKSQSVNVKYNLKKKSN